MLSCLRIGKKKWIFSCLCLTLCPILGGCVVGYEQRGKTQADFDRDKKYCQSVAEKEYQRKGTRICDEAEACLRSLGWSGSRSLW